MQSGSYRRPFGTRLFVKTKRNWKVAYRVYYISKLGFNLSLYYYYKLDHTMLYLIQNKFSNLKKTHPQNIYLTKLGKSGPHLLGP